MSSKNCQEFSAIGFSPIFSDNAGKKMLIAALGLSARLASGKRGREGFHDRKPGGDFDSFLRR